MIVRSLHLLLVLVPVALAPLVHAQDDWSLDRTPPSARSRTPRGPGRGPRAHGAGPPPAVEPQDRLIERYREIVERDSTDAFALRRWIALVRERDGSTDALVAELRSAPRSLLWPTMALAAILEEQGADEDARSAYRDVSERFPRAVGPALALGHLLREGGDLAGARAELARGYGLAERALRDSIGRELVEVLVELAAFDEARRLDAELAGPQASVDRRLELPRALAARGHHAEALTLLAALSARVGGDPRARVPVALGRARSELALGRSDEAIESLTAALVVARGGQRVEAYDLAYEAYRAADRLDDLGARLRREPGIEAAALLARLEEERGDDVAAIEAYDRAVRLQPRDLALRERRAQVLLRSGHVDEAVEALMSLQRSAADEPRYLVELGTLLRDAGRPDEARRALVGASRARPRDARLHQRLAEVFARWGDDANALLEVRSLVRIEPDEDAHRILLGDLLLAAGDRAGALAAWRSLVEGDDEASASAHAALGAVLMDHDLLDEARVELDRAAELSPDDPDVLGRLVDALVRAGRDADAEPIAERLLAGAATDPAREREARERQVSIWIRRRTLDSHLRTLERRFAGEPPDVAVGSLLAEALRRGGHLARAEAVLERMVELRDDDVSAWTSLERVRVLRGELLGALAALDRLVEIDAPHAASHLARMSEHALALYRDEDAVRYAERAVALAPDDALGHRRLGDLFRRRQDPAESLAHYQRALSLDPRLHDLAMEVAELRRARGETAAAEALFASVIADALDDELVERAVHAALESALVGAGARPLLDRLLPLALARFDRPVFARATLEVIEAMASGLVPRALGSGADRALAREELRAVAARGLPILLRALSSDDPRERATALSILIPARLEAASSALLALVESGREPALRQRTLEAVVEASPPSLVPRLAALAVGADVATARAASWGLARIGGAAARTALVGLLAHADGDVVSLAALGLAHQGDRRAAGALRQTLARTATPTVRAALVLALSALGEPIEADSIDELLASGGPALAVHALLARPVEALAGTDSAAARAVVAALVHEPADLRASWPLLLPSESGLALGLRAIATSPAHAPDPEIAERARAVMVAALRGPAPLPALRGLEVRESRLGLGACDDPPGCAWLLEPSDALVAALPADSSDAVVRAEVARLAVALAAERTDAMLEALLRDPAPAVVERVVRGLARGSRVADRLAPALAAVLESSADWTLRLAAAEALGRTRRGVESALGAALAGDPYAFVREAAARALAARVETAASPGAEELARACALDAEPRVRSAACFTPGTESP